MGSKVVRWSFAEGVSWQFTYQHMPSHFTAPSITPCKRAKRRDWTRISASQARLTHRPTRDTRSAWWSGSERNEGELLGAQSNGSPPESPSISTYCTYFTKARIADGLELGLRYRMSVGLSALEAPSAEENHQTLLSMLTADSISRHSPSSVAQLPCFR